MESRAYYLDKELKRTSIQQSIAMAYKYIDELKYKEDKLLKDLNLVQDQLTTQWAVIENSKDQGKELDR